MIGGVLLALAIAGAPSGPVVQNRRPLAVHVGGGVLTATHRTELLAALGPAIASTTLLEPVGLNSWPELGPSFDRCAAQGSFRCWADALWRDSRALAPLLLLINGIALEGRKVRLAAFVLDVEVGHAILEGRGRDESESLEAELYDRAITSTVRPLTLDDRAQLTRDLVELIEGELAPRFDAARVLFPSGELVINPPSPGLQVVVDGQVIGISAEGPLEVSGVRTGPVQVELSDPAGVWVPWAGRAEIRRGEVAHLRPEMGRAEPSLGRTVTLWSGVGVGVAGVGILAYSLAARPSAVDAEVCVVGTCAPGRRFARASDYGTSPGPASGPLMAPLGYSLLLGGGAAAGGALVGEPTTFPWWAIVAGVAIGALSYGVSEALD